MTDKPIEITPSKLDRAVLCPGSPRMTKDIPWSDSQPAARGRALHEAMALLFQVGDKAWDKIKSTVPYNPVCKPGDVEVLETAYDVGKNLYPADLGTVTLIEHPLDVNFLGMKGGKPDAVFVSPQFEQAVLIDWKFGAGAVDDPEQNWQIKAYGAALVANLDDALFLKRHNIALEPLKLKGIEAAIVQPSAYKAQDSVRSHLFSRDELREQAKVILDAVNKAKLPDAPLVAGPIQCRFCDAKPNCPAYRDFNMANAEHKAAEFQAQVAQVTTLGTPVTVRPVNEIIFPLVVINAETVAKAKETRDLILSLKVTDQSTADTMGRLSKEARGTITLIDKNRRAILKPIEDEVIKVVNAEAKKATDPLNDAAEHADAQVEGWRKAERERAEKIRLEEEAKQKAAELARAKAEEEERKKMEAAARALKAAARADEEAANAGTEAERAEAAAQAEKKRLKAEADIKAAQEAQDRRIAEEQKAREAQAAQVAAVGPAKVIGYRDATDTTWEIPDFSLVPKELLSVVLMQNDKVLKTMIATGTLTEAKHSAWLKITRTEVSKRSR